MTNLKQLFAIVIFTAIAATSACGVDQANDDGVDEDHCQDVVVEGDHPVVDDAWRIGSDADPANAPLSAVERCPRSECDPRAPAGSCGIQRTTSAGAELVH